VVLKKSLRYKELREILPAIDECVQALLRLDHSQDTGTVQMVWSKVQELQETVHRHQLTERHPQVHEVVSFLYLSCFSLLFLNGESFPAYQEEVRQRYKMLLRTIYILRRYPSFDEKRISNL
jgi:hypothetical protein